uniref:Uncharacterized protein n=1 Tax=Ditylenchus dipsaci TaxID=166011 RepID=A0A915EA39_9BILA
MTDLLALTHGICILLLMAGILIALVSSPTHSMLFMCKLAWSTILARKMQSQIFFLSKLFFNARPSKKSSSVCFGSRFFRGAMGPPLHEYGVITHYMVTWSQNNLADSTDVAKTKDVCNSQKNTPQIIHSAASNTVSVRSDDSKGPAQKKRAAANALLSSPMKIL